MVSSAPTRLGKYDIVRALGEGAMGVVYEAVDRVIERTVAIKTIRRGDLDADEAAEHGRRFLVEAKAAGKLNHPNIIGLYDHGNESGLAYIVMELVQGRELQHWFDEGHVFALGDVLRLMGELLDALGYSHQRGVIHRDVKPSNIFVTDGGRIKLGDFGIARIESSQKTRIGTALGTPSHMAPEQIRGETADARSDLYAAGVVLFQFLTGTRPFAGTMLTMALKVLNDPAPAPSTLRPGVSPQLDAVVAKALAKRAADRYQSAAEFWRALAAAGGADLGTAGLGASGFGGSGFGASGFGGSDFGTSGVGTGNAWDSDSRAGHGTTRESSAPSASRPGHLLAPREDDAAPATRAIDKPRPDVAQAPPRAAQATAAPAAGRRVPVAAWLAIGGLAVLLLAGLWWRLRPLPPTPSAPSPTPAQASAPKPPAMAAPPVADGAAPGTTPTPAPAPAPAPGSDPAPAPALAPAMIPTPALTPAPTRADPARRVVREAPRPAPPRPAVNPPAPPQAKAPRPARCSDILQKASLEPLTGEEAAYLRRECQ